MKKRNVQRILASFLFLGLLSCATYASSDEAIKIAVAATGQEHDASISRQAAKAPFFLFFDGSGNLSEAVENAARNEPRNAGPIAASFLADQGATLVIAEDYGNKMKQGLDKNHIKYIEKTGAADKAVLEIIEK
ncbi:MAG: hypothetical protein H8E79_01365 [Desulfobulbaceae bacterium]|uniref:Dinitrogenase iron-molybdenum cofactor biosynthesis domain-containing protein n=1 Tax=Candidatus Desulfatifera sulfidica TaxID=2841691 RepID=A0A8J6TCZ6_9BACT|nr:hypothetical protein [Candidatus Desulfatifera sulfidica]